MRDDLVDLLKPSVEALGYEFWGLEFAGGGKRKSLLRVYIDQEQGISVEDCELVSRQLSRVLDVEDPIKTEYALEVSSPGLDRTLFYPEQYPHYCGELMSVKTIVPIAGQRNFKGVLSAVHKDKIILVEADKEVSIDFDNIHRANLIIDWHKVKE